MKIEWCYITRFSPYRNMSFSFYHMKLILPLAVNSVKISESFLLYKHINSTRFSSLPSPRPVCRVPIWTWDPTPICDVFSSLPAPLARSRRDSIAALSALDRKWWRTRSWPDPFASQSGCRTDDTSSYLMEYSGIVIISQRYTMIWPFKIDWSRCLPFILELKQNIHYSHTWIYKSGWNNIVPSWFFPRCIGLPCLCDYHSQGTYNLKRCIILSCK